jgi:hypothetical protein
MRNIKIIAHESMNDLWKSYAKWKKPDAKGHMLYDSLCMKYPQ